MFHIQNKMIKQFTYLYYLHFYNYLRVYLLLFSDRSVKVFSIKEIAGTIIKKCANYKTVLNCPNSIKGDSTCLAPICINTKKLATNI